jgi:hypothetical protein
MSLFGKVMQFFGFTDSGKSSGEVIAPDQGDREQSDVNLDATIENIRKNLKEAKKIKNSPDTTDTTDNKVNSVNVKQKIIRDKSKKCSSDINNIIDKVTSFPQRKLRSSKIAPAEGDDKEENILKDPIGKKIKKLISDTITVDTQEEVVDTAKNTAKKINEIPAPSITPAQIGELSAQIGKLSKIAESSLQKSKIMYEQDASELLSEFQDDLCKDYNELGEELEEQLYQDFLEFVIPQTSENLDENSDIATTAQSRIETEVSLVIKKMIEDRNLKISDDILDSVVKSETHKLTKFWLKKLKDNPVDSSIWKVIFKRTAVNIAALGAYDVFNSFCNTQNMGYYQYKLTRYDRDPVKLKPATMDDKPDDTLSKRITDIFQTIPKPSNYKSVVIGDYKFTVGPIVDTARFIGRTFVYVKCELTEDKKQVIKGEKEKKLKKNEDEEKEKMETDDTIEPLDHFYFWVYLSQSEGMFRVFFMLYAQFAIEKGVDYTQATLVHFKLQKILNEYYNEYYKKVPPTVINTLGGINHFILNMSYLHDDDFFLDLVRAQEHDNMFMGIGVQTTYVTRDYYIVDSPSLLSKGMPLDAINHPEDYSHDKKHQENYLRVMEPEIQTEKYKDIQNNPVRTYPLVVCFSTVVFKSPPASMSALLNPFFYNNTFWVQGACNYTLPCGILSPVLFTVMGSSLLYPDYELSRIRTEIMNIPQGYKDANFVSMTSMELFISQDTDFNVYLPTKTTRTSFSNARNAIFKEMYQNMAKYETIDVDLTEDPDYVPISEFSPINLPEDQKDPSKITATKICDWYLSGGTVSDLFGDDSGLFFSKLGGIFTKYPKLQPRLNTILMRPSTRNTFETNLAVIGDFSNKRNFLYSMFDNAYNICNGLLNCDESDLSLYYLNKFGVWSKLSSCDVLNPNSYASADSTDLNVPYIFESKFSEIKNSLPVTVHTLAHIYALQIPYTEVLETAVSPHPDVPHTVNSKSMHMIFQISSTIVYDNARTIHYAIDMQKTPIACLPDLDVAVPTTTYTDMLESIFTNLGTFKRYSAWGAFFASKMMEYLGNYNQLPLLFAEFPEILQVCETYTTTAPFFNYNDIKPYSFIIIRPEFSFSEIFQAKIPFQPGSVSPILKSKTEDIKLFTEIFINPFVKQFDEFELFNEEEEDTDDDDDQGGGTIIVSTTNNDNPEDNIDIEVVEIKNKNKSNKRLVKQRLFEIYLKTGKIPKPKHKASLSHVVLNRNVQKQSPKHRSKSVKIAKHINLRNTRRVRDGRN